MGDDDLETVPLFLAADLPLLSSAHRHPGGDHLRVWIILVLLNGLRC